jgi:hypothetical protein
MKREGIRMTEDALARHERIAAALSRAERKKKAK